MTNDSEKYSEPCFGQIGFSRINGTQRFYGSELQQDNYIEMRVYESELERNLTDDRYFVRDHMPILKVRMSAIQYSEMITNMNCGNGVPCTIETFNKKPVEPLKFQENRKDFVHRKFNARMREFAQSIRIEQQKAKELVKKKTLSKDDVRDLSFHLEWLTAEIEKNIPFFMECFQETMDEVVLEAKTEIESAIQHKITTLGLTELHKQNALLSKNTDPMK